VIKLFTSLSRAGGLGLGFLLIKGHNQFSEYLIEIQVTLLFWEITLGMRYKKRF